MVFQDTYSQPDAPDPVLDAEQVLALVRRHAPEARSVTEVDESGGEARAYAIDTGVILKTQRPHRLRPRTSLEREVCFLRQLATDECISVPRVLGYGREGSIEYICMTRMAGVPVRRSTLAGAPRAAALRELGRTLRRIHALPQQPLIDSGLFPADRSSSDVRFRLSSAFERLAGVIATTPEAWALAQSPEEVGAVALSALPDAELLVALHSNPGPEHMFVDYDSGAFSGLIDFGDAYISHPAFDLTQWRTPADRVALLEGYAADGPLSPAFHATWRIGLILAEMRSIALRRPAPSEAAATLGDLLAELHEGLR